MKRKPAASSTTALAKEQRQWLPWQIILNSFAVPFPANYAKSLCHLVGKGFPFLMNW